MTDRRHELLSTAFEEADGGWVYYASAWSRGVIVTSEERDLYLASKRSAFKQAIAGRQASGPRRRYWRTLKRLLVAVVSGRDPNTKRSYD